MVSVKECTEINLALEGNNQIRGISMMANITQGKYAICQLAKQIKPVIEAYNDTLKSIREKYYEQDEKGLKVDKENKLIIKEGLKVADAEKENTDNLNGDCGVTLMKINVAWLEKIPEVTPKHLELLMPVLTDSK